MKGDIFGSEMLGFILFTLLVSNFVDTDIILKIDIYLPDEKFSHFNRIQMLNTAFRIIHSFNLTYTSVPIQVCCSSLGLGIKEMRR